MNDSIRLFVAATLPAALKQTLQEQVQHFEGPEVRALPTDNLHLTLHFIGDVPAQRLPDIQQRIAEVAQRHQPFTLALERTEAGPTAKHPRLVWARFAAHDAFASLNRDLADALSDTPPKKQKPVPHVTLARFRKDMPPPQHLPTLAAPPHTQLQVGSIALWQSRLGSPHPTYTVLLQFPVG